MIRIKIIKILFYFIFSSNALAQAVEKINIKTFTPADYYEIIDGSYKSKSTTIDGYLVNPKKFEKSPAVIIIPGSGGYQEWMQKIVASKLNEQGIATIIVDSFSGRGVKETSTNQAFVPMAASVMDALMTLKTLSSRLDIDPKRVGVTGFSRGGVASMFSAEAKIYESLDMKNLKFSAHLPFYPGCSIQFENLMPSNAPIMFMLGSEDDLTPSKWCIDYTKRLALAGANAEYKIYQGAHHGWISDVQGVHYLSRAQVFGKCSAKINDKGYTIDNKTGFSTADGWSNFVKKLMSSCGGYGANYGSKNDINKESALSDMVDFFNKNLK